MNAEIYNTAEELVGLLKEKKLLIATAESCSAGIVCGFRARHGVILLPNKERGFRGKKGDA